MSDNQLNSLNLNLIPTDINNKKDLLTNDELRNKLVIFYYKLKKNYDNFQNNLSICPIKINWNISDSSAKTIYSNVLYYNKNNFINANLSKNLYYYINSMRLLNEGFVSYMVEALRIDCLLKKQAYLYFREKKFKNIKEISNYNDYYFLQ